MCRNLKFYAANYENNRGECDAICSCVKLKKILVPERKLE